MHLYLLSMPGYEVFGLALLPIFLLYFFYLVLKGYLQKK